MTLQLADYEFNIRSFHPEKTFGWSGLMFERDNRGFSLKPSGTESVTSRIWHKFYLSTTENKVHSKETVSDPSKAPWERAKGVYSGELAPKGRTFLKTQ